jgi:hypothetical protein
MVKVYFENDNGSYSELVAKFDNEEIYFACLPALEKLAEKNGFDYVTETIDEDEI